MKRPKDEPALPELSAQTVAMMTAEHSSLQAGRFMTVSEASGRSTLFIGTVSGALIAIAFTGQASQMGPAFFMFSLVLFPALVLMGLFTFERVLQAGIEDLIYARGINLLRHPYLQHTLQMHLYFILSAHDAGGHPVLCGFGIQRRSTPWSRRPVSLVPCLTPDLLLHRAVVLATA